MGAPSVPFTGDDQAPTSSTVACDERASDMARSTAARAAGDPSVATTMVDMTLLLVPRPNVPVPPGPRHRGRPGFCIGVDTDARLAPRA